MGIICSLFGHRFELVSFDSHDFVKELGRVTVPQCSRCHGCCNNRLHYGSSHKCDSLEDISIYKTHGGPGSW